MPKRLFAQKARIYIDQEMETVTGYSTHSYYVRGERIGNSIPAERLHFGRRNWSLIYTGGSIPENIISQDLATSLGNRKAN
jgi:hypothetical protein